MLRRLLTLAQPALLTLPPERAHEVSLRALEMGLAPGAAPDDPKLAQTVWGLPFANPVGMAAGFDKNGRVPDALMASGFGYAEAGTVTPRPQDGNPRPRVFRLISDGALINRLGFNNDGHDALHARFARRARRGVVGVNIGANKDSDDRIADYVAGLRRFYGVADYFTVNISSPNTPGLRDLQQPEALGDLLSRVMAARDELIADGTSRCPVVVKLAPDIEDGDLPAVLEQLTAHRVDGVIISNTTLSRTGLTDHVHAGETGGLSGRPLFARSTRMLARVYLLTDGKIPLVGVGGIHSGETALAKIEAGAALLQLYTGLIYEGAGLLDRIKRTLVEHCQREGFATISEATGRKAQEWADRSSD